MNKNKKSIGLYLTLVAGIIAIVEAVYYGKVMYTFQPVYYFLAAAIVLAVLSFVLVGFNKVITGFIPVVNAALMAMQIMSIKYPKLKEDLKTYRQEMAQKVLDDDKSINQEL